MTTPILQITEIANGQVDQYLTVNEAIRILEAAANNVLSVDLSASDYSVTNVAPDFEMLRYFMFSASGNTVARTITFSASKRNFSVQNGGTFDLSVTIGATTLTVPAGDAHLFYCDGTTDGLLKID